MARRAAEGGRAGFDCRQLRQHAAEHL
eukprot:SAG11_NODE_8813_length_973_cov_2.921053_1_plen_26_part_01